MSDFDDYYLLDPRAVNPVRLKKEREKARKLKKSQWWQTRISSGLCHYCEKKVPRDQLTMDHIVPLARGGRSTPGNVVPACAECNRNKKLHTPVDQLLKDIGAQKNDQDPEEGEK